jgi:acetoin utilization deacetylase AcuC-like enzyme
MSDDKKTGLLYSNEYLNHVTPEGHPESARRAEVVIKGLEDEGLMERLQRIEAPAAPARAKALPRRAREARRSGRAVG